MTAMQNHAQALPMGITQGNESGWDRHVFDDLVALIGSVKAKRIVERFCIDLTRRFSSETSRDVLRSDAHTITSTAGMLGFVALSEAARSLETACQSPGEIAASLEQVIAARNDVLRSLAAPGR